jgi:archaellum component FlaC
MHIELLWLIPVFAFAGFLFFIAFYVQRRDELQSKGSDLSKEVALFNAGQSVHGRKEAQGNHDERLRELEKAINVLSTSLSTECNKQEQNKENRETGGTSEVDELKEKLRTVFREYDIVLSENYALRAKVKQIMKKAQLDDIKPEEERPSMDSFLTRTTPQAKPDLHLYGDTRLMKIIELEPDEEDVSGSSISLS